MSRCGYAFTTAFGRAEGFYGEGFGGRTETRSFQLRDLDDY